MDSRTTPLASRFKIIYHQIEQHKEEIKEKDQTLIKEHFEHHKVQQHCEQTKEQLHKARTRMTNLQGPSQGPA